MQNTTNETAARVRIIWRETSTGLENVTYMRPSGENWQARLASAYNRLHHTRGWYVALVNRVAEGSYRVQMGQRVAAANASRLAPEMSVWLDDAD